LAFQGIRSSVESSLHIVFWHWWVVAVSLIVLELLWPRYMFLWLGFAAAAVGFLLLLFDSTPIRAQIVLFGILSAVAIAAWRRHRRRHPPRSG